LILKPGNAGGLNLRAHFQNIYNRNGTLNSLQQTLTLFYGTNYCLESLQGRGEGLEVDLQEVPGEN
jgi:hypothetical protein